MALPVYRRDLQDGKIIKFVQLIAFKFYSKKSKIKPLFTERSIYSVIHRPRHLPTQTRKAVNWGGTIDIKYAIKSFNDASA